LAKAAALGAVGAKVVQLDQQSMGRLSRMDALQSEAMAEGKSPSARGAKAADKSGFVTF